MAYFHRKFSLFERFCNVCPLRKIINYDLHSALRQILIYRQLAYKHLLFNYAVIVRI